MTSNQVSVSNGHVTYQVSKHSLMAEPWDSGPTPKQPWSWQRKVQRPPGVCSRSGGCAFHFRSLVILSKCNQVWARALRPQPMLGAEESPKTI